VRAKAHSYKEVRYEELPEELRKKALKQVKREYRSILADAEMLVRLIEKQRTSFHEDGSLYHLIPYQQMFVTTR
jgi:hypothetical protein